jgi:hypothetical protein
MPSIMSTSNFASKITVACCFTRFMDIERCEGRVGERLFLENKGQNDVVLRQNLIYKVLQLYEGLIESGKAMPVSIQLRAEKPKTE